MKYGSDTFTLIAARTRRFNGIRQRITARARRGIMVATLLAATGLIAACGDDSTSPRSLDIQGIIVEKHDGSVAYVHGDHWHGSLRIDEGHSEHVHLYYIDFHLEGHDAPAKSTWKTLPNGFEVAGIVENTEIAGWSGTQLEGTLTGKEEGATRINFVVRRAGASTTMYEAPPLNVQVLAHEHEHE